MLSFAFTEVREYKVYINMPELPSGYDCVQLFYLFRCNAPKKADNCRRCRKGEKRG